jgi:hypothetical protein
MAKQGGYKKLSQECERENKAGIQKGGGFKFESKIASPPRTQHPPPTTLNLPNSTLKNRI